MRVDNLNASSTINAEGTITTDQAFYVEDIKMIDTFGITFMPGIPQLGVKASGALTFTGGVIEGEKVTIGDTNIEISVDGVVTEGFELADISDGTPSQASAKMSIAGYPLDGDTIEVSDGNATDIYEIDALGTGVESGNIQVDLSSQYAKATATLTFTDVVADGEVVEINGVQFEIDDDDSATEGNVQVWVGANTDAASAIIALAAAIRSNEGCNVVAVDGAGDTLVVTAKDYGTAANSYTVSTTCENGSWGESVTTLSGGDQPTPAEVINAIVTASTGGTVAVTFTAGTGDNLGKLICTATSEGVLDGSAGNGVTVDTTSEAFEWDGTTLIGGTDATYAEAIAAIAALDVEGVTLTAGSGANAAKLFVEADDIGINGNFIETSTTIANATWGSTTLTGGTEKLTYEQEYNGKGMFDGSNLYIAFWNEETEQIVWNKFTGSIYTG